MTYGEMMAQSQEAMPAEEREALIARVNNGREDIDTRRAQDLQPIHSPEELENMSPDEARAWIEDVWRLWRASDTQIGEMMGCSKSPVRKIASRVGAQRPGGKPYMSPDRLREWRIWAGLDTGSNAPEAPAPEATHPGNTTQRTGALTITGTLGDAASMLQALSLRDNGIYTIDINWIPA